jgi:diguanylate cyclase (GGDEF)-like protein/PAS domain S-box-containing protein
MSKTQPGLSLIERITNGNIRSKLTALVHTTLLIAVLFVFASSAILMVSSGIDDKRHELQMLANVTAHNLEASLLFSDEKSAAEILQSLRESTDVDSALLQDVSGNNLAVYYSEHLAQNGESLEHWLPIQSSISINRDIVVEGRSIGRLSLQASLHTVWLSLLTLILEMTVATFIAALIAFYLAKRLTTFIIDPISKIVNTARNISLSGDYTLRINKTSEDEIGSLADELNNMMDTINQRDKLLRDAESTLVELNADLSATLKAIPDLLFELGDDGEYINIWANNPELLAAQRKELLGHTINEILPPEAANTMMSALKEAEQKGVSRGYIIRRDLPHGASWFELSTSIKQLPSSTPHAHFIMLSRDITEHIHSEQQLRIAATAFESHEGMMITDADANILQVNHAFTAITGYEAADVIGKNPRILSSGRQNTAFYAAMWESINNTGQWEGEIWNRRKNGEIYPQRLTIATVNDKDGVMTNFVASMTDTSASRNAAEKIEHLAFYDPLTNLPNRRLLVDRLGQVLAASTRSGKQGAVLFIDLDNFKALNDTMGHGAGDLLLQQVAERLTSCVRETDTVSRLGGDEFVVALESLGMQSFEAAAQAEVTANNILTAINAPYKLNDSEYNITSSIGITMFNDRELNVEELLKQADIAMYQAKKSGRNCLRFFDPAMQESINIRTALEADLRVAIERQQFQLYYQVQTHSSGRVLGAETLIRWIHPVRGMVPPTQFIPLAEESGLILSIGSWVLETACAQLKLWQESKLTQDLSLSVNVSARQFHQPDFVDKVQDAVQRYALKPGQLKLELTEGMLLENVDDIIATMSELRNAGIQFSLDDFGTGYSSLQYLKKLPLSQLKIDQSFVRDIATGQNDAAIVRTIIAMAETLGLNVIAEGVETEAQREFLELQGCHAFQGFLFGKPMLIEQFEALLRQG